MSPPIGLKSLLKSPQLKGLWTWSRGGGWWGPFIHGQEQWVDLHVQVRVLYCTALCYQCPPSSPAACLC